MSEERVERRLAAILAGDVVGYSRLMGADEIGTLRALKAIRNELTDPARFPSPVMHIHKTRSVRVSVCRVPGCRFYRAG